MKQTQRRRASTRQEIEELANKIRKSLALHEYGRALKEVGMLLEISPDNEEALLAKVQLLLYFRKLRDADRTVDIVLKKYPKSPYAHLSKAIITVLYTSNIKEALRHLDNGIDACPDCFELLVAKAQMLYWLGDPNYNLWIERAERLDKERAEKFLARYWVEKLPMPAAYPLARLHGLIENILFLISQQRYDGRGEITAEHR